MSRCKFGTLTPHEPINDVELGLNTFLILSVALLYYLELAYEEVLLYYGKQTKQPQKSSRRDSNNYKNQPNGLLIVNNSLRDHEPLGYIIVLLRNTTINSTVGL